MTIVKLDLTSSERTLLSSFAFSHAASIREHVEAQKQKGERVGFIESNVSSMVMSLVEADRWNTIGESIRSPK